VNHFGLDKKRRSIMIEEGKEIVDCCKEESVNEVTKRRGKGDREA